MFRSCWSGSSGSPVLPEPRSSPRGALLNLVALRGAEPLVCRRAGCDTTVRRRPAVAGPNLLDVLMIALATVQEPDRDLCLAPTDSDLGPRIVAHGGLRKGCACVQQSMA